MPPSRDDGHFGAITRGKIPEGFREGKAPADEESCTDGGVAARDR
jgi:hypothetical protein